MKTLTVCEVPGEVYALIREEAATNQHNVQEQMRYFLAKAATLFGVAWWE